MKYLRPFCIAMSMYTRIPMPQFEWKEEDMRWAICWFPAAGVLTGIFLWLWLGAAERLQLNLPARVIFAAVLPVLVNGGIHLDGFMDTSDALHSFGDRAKRLEILKDPHIGAFAVIRLLCLAGIWLAALFCIEAPAFFTWCVSFAFSRALSGYAAVTMPKAKAEGSLNRFADPSVQRRAAGILLFEILLFAAAMAVSSPLCGAAAVLAGILVFLYCRQSAMKNFGGITGDIAGWFLCLCEVWIAAALAAVSVLCF